VETSETELLFLTDAYAQSTSAQVVAVQDGRMALDQTIFYPTGGGQPHDTGSIVAGASTFQVTSVKKQGPVVWHSVDPAPTDELVGTEVQLGIDWERRHQLMRTHSAMHVLCGVIWNEFSKSVTGGNMEPLKGRMDFEFDPLPDGFADMVTTAVQKEIAADRPISVSFRERDDALADEDLIRTKVNLIPEFVTTIRVIDIEGLDKQADGGTHVRSTGEIGNFRITKTESKGKGNKRVRIELS